MKSLYLLVFLSSMEALVQGFFTANKFPEPDCGIDYGLINCTCTSRQDVVIAVIKENVTGVEIRHCGQLTIHISAFYGLELTYLILDDIIDLKIDTLAFIGLTSLDILHIANIGTLEVDQYAIEIVNTKYAIFQNVVADYLPSYFLEAIDVASLVVENCVFGTIDKSAFALVNTKLFSLLNTKVDTIHSGALQLNGSTNKVDIRNSTFSITEDNSFYFEDVKRLTFENCSFKLMHSHFAVGNMQQFEFSGNVISVAENHSFSGLSATSLYSFHSNFIIVSESEALKYPFENVDNVSVRNNTFTCSCDLEWMWKDEFQRFRETSYCKGNEGRYLPVTGVNLSGNNGSDCSEIVHTEKAVAIIQEEEDVDMTDSLNKSASRRNMPEISTVFLGAYLLCVLKTTNTIF